MNENNIQNLRLLEAILFSSPGAVTERELAGRLPDDADVKGLLDELANHYAGRGVNLLKAGKSWAMRTAPDLAARLSKSAEVHRKLGRATIETLAIIAYHQPMTRAEIEEIRGVGLSRGTLDILFEAGWIRPKGRRRTPGRPTTWGTTDAFLDHFGMESLGDLPGIEEIKAAGLLSSGPSIEVYKANDLADNDDELPDGDYDVAEPLDPDDRMLDEKNTEGSVSGPDMDDKVQTTGGG